MSRSVLCTWCGEVLVVPDDYAAPTLVCPKCGSTCGIAGAAAPSPAKTPAAVAESARTAVTRREKPAPPPADKLAEAIRAAPERPRAAQDLYGVTDVVKRCPECAKVLADDAVVCPGCEFNLETGTFPPRNFEKIERHWEMGLPRQKRWQLFLAYEGGLLFLGLVLFWQQATLGGLLYYGVIVSAAAVFVLGTYNELDLTRTSRGRVTLNMTWHVAFFRADTTRIKLGDYESVVTSATSEHGFFDWLILIWLLLSGVLPGVIWWIYFFRRETYQVALTREHGYPAMVLYRGWNEEQAKDITQTLGQAWPFPRGSE